MRQKPSGHRMRVHSFTTEPVSKAFPNFVKFAVFVTLGFSSLLSTASAQDLILSYANAFGGSGADYGTSIAVDESGNVYFVGVFSHSADFDPGPEEFILTSQGWSDIVVCKLDASGTFQWAKAVGGSERDNVSGVAIDYMGNIYIVGYFDGVVDIDPGPGSFELTSTGSVDILFFKLDASGDFQWGGAMGGRDIDVSYDFALDGSGNMYITGEFRDTADFDPGPGVFNLTSAGSSDAYVCKVDASGAFQWAETMGGSIGDMGFGVAVDTANSVYITGQFGTTAAFGQGVSAPLLTSAGAIDVFVCKLNTSGEVQWAKAMGGPNSDRGNNIGIDSTGGVYCTGFFTGTADLDPGPGVLNASSSGLKDAFICKLDSLGELQWGSTIGGTGDDTGSEIEVDHDGSVYGIGSFEDTADFDPGPGTLDVVSAGNSDIFVVKLGTSGTLQWAGAVGGDEMDTGTAIAVGSMSEVYVTGWFSTTVDFDPSLDIHDLSSAGSLDAFVLKLVPKTIPVATNDYGETNADQILTSLSSPASTTVLLNDTDNNTMDVLSVVAHDTTSTFGASVVVNPDGTFIYDPTGVALLQALPPGDSLEDSFTYTVSDGTDSAVGTVTITVYGAGTMLPALAAWGLGLLCLTLAGAGVKSRTKS